MIPEDVKNKPEKIQILKFGGVDSVNLEKEAKFWRKRFFDIPDIFCILIFAKLYFFQKKKR